MTEEGTVAPKGTNSSGGNVRARIAQVAAIARAKTPSVRKVRRARMTTASTRTTGRKRLAARHNWRPLTDRRASARGSQGVARPAAICTPTPKMNTAKTVAAPGMSPTGLSAKKAERQKGRAEGVAPETRPGYPRP